MMQPSDLTSALTILKSFTERITAFSEEDWAEFSAIWKQGTAKRKQILSAPGESERYLYFITDGVQRVFYSDEQGREATLVFTYAPSFGGVLDSFMMQVPSEYTYETLTVSSFLRASHTDFMSLAGRSAAVASLVQTGVSGALGGVLKRLAELQCYSSEEKFRSLMKRSPQILNLIPHKYIANYLGIDAGNFSKFINRIVI